MPKQKRNISLTREQEQDILNKFNTVGRSIDDFLHSGEMFVSDAHGMQQLLGEMIDLFGFRPPKDEEGNPKWYENKVLHDDPKAWYYDETA